MNQTLLFDDPKPIAPDFVSATGITPRRYQQDAIESVFDAFGKGNGAMVRLPTGCGKTIVGTLIAAQWIEQSDNHHVMVIAHERQLIWQFAQEIEDVTGIGPGIEMAEERVSSWAMPKIIIASRATLVSRTIINEEGVEVPVSRLFKFDHSINWLLIWDEAHRHAHKLSSVTHIVDWFEQNPNSKQIGLTATPERTDKTTLARMFPIIASDYRLYDMGGGPCAVTDGWAVPYDQRFITVDGVDFNELRTIAGDFDQNELDEALRKQETLAKLCEPMHELVGNRRTLIFCVTVQMAQDVVCYLNAKEGCTVAKCLHGKVPEDERRVVYREHKRDGFQYLVVCGLCVAGGTLVLTDKGEVPIEDVTTGMKLWDGVEFVSHNGVISKGVKPVIEYAGLIATGEHNAWTDGGWRSLAACKQQRLEIRVSAIEGEAVFESDGYYRGSDSSRQSAAGWIRSKMRWLRKGERQICLRNQAGPGWLQAMFQVFGCSELVANAVSFCTKAVRKSKRQALQGLRWARNQVQFCFASGNGTVDHEQPWAAQEPNYRSQGQHRTLRAGQHQVGQPERASEQSETSESRLYEEPERDTKAEVYDILNAGPRNRFTANGLIISNCREGYNDPGIAAIAVFRPTKSRPLAEQMKGRGCRPLKGLVDGFKTAAERVEAIANSAKPNCLIVDMVGVSGLGGCATTAHIYANGLPDEVVDRANKNALKCDGPIDMPKLLDEAAEELKEEEAQRKLARQRATEEAAEKRRVRDEKAQRKADRLAKLDPSVRYSTSLIGQAGNSGVRRGVGQGSGVLTFGKFKGRKITDCPSYYQRWMKKKMPGKYWSIMKAGESHEPGQATRSVEDINRMFDGVIE